MLLLLYYMLILLVLNNNLKPMRLRAIEYLWYWDKKTWFRASENHVGMEKLSSICSNGTLTSSLVEHSIQGLRMDMIFNQTVHISIATQ